MKSSWAAIAVALASVSLIPACGQEAHEEEAQEEEVPSLLRVRFESEMKTILRDVKAAEEMAGASEGRYLELGELRSRYLSREIPDTYELTLADVSASGYRAEIVHGATGLRCVLDASGGGPGIPACR